jgi:hypothetical protein
MNISEDILRFNLQNVYFLFGTACGGKTTMAKAISEKYGFAHFNDNYHEENFKHYQAIMDERHKGSVEYTESADYDWERHFNRPPEEYNRSLEESYRDYIEYAIIEIIKLAQAGTVVADIGLHGISADFLGRIAPRGRIACLLAPPELIVKDYYERADHRDIYEAIMRLREPDRALRNMNETLKYGARAVIDDVMRSGLFHIMRDEASTVEDALRRLERHFGL